MTLTRRDVLRLAAAAAAAPLVPHVASGSAPPSPALAPAAGRFLSAPEMGLLDELTELIVPADEHSGGAHAAGVASYIDGRLAEYDPTIPDLGDARERWKAGLAAIDSLARETTSHGFLEATAEQRLAVLEQLAAKENDPRTDGERFFVELKSWTARGYYTSKVGLHDEMEYKGNTLQMEFSGIDPATLPPARPPEE